MVKENRGTEVKSGFNRVFQTEVTDVPDYIEPEPKPLSKKTLMEQAAGRRALEPYGSADEPDKAKG